MYVPLNVSRHEESFQSEIALYGHGIFFLQATLKPSTPPMRCQSLPLRSTARAAAAAAGAATAAVAAAARFCVSGTEAAG